jgi:hypothetical protein
MKNKPRDSEKQGVLDATIRPRRVSMSAPHRPGTEAIPQGTEAVLQGTARERLRIPHIKVEPKEKS